VVFLLGNHDRIGLYTDAENWFPILRLRTHVQAFDKPGVVDTGNGRLFLLPYTTSRKRLLQQSKDLASYRPKPQRDILVFHADLKGCDYNKLGHKSEATFRAKDLHPERYRACIGGHIHLHQKIGKNVYYTGSPFASDWGEANQQKGFIVVEDSKVSFVPSGIPGWYDKSWSGFREPDDWRAAYVRIHVTCPTGGNYGRILQRARDVAEGDYPGAHIYVVAEFEEDSRQGQSGLELKISDSDKKKVAVYVRETLSDRLQSEEDRMVAYLTAKLLEVGGRLRSGERVEFLSAKAEHFLSFKKVTADYSQPGIVVVQGRNRDWHGHSNGSGKTSYLQLIPVALFGKTFKDQRHDAWANRRTERKARVSLRLRDGKGRIVRVVRTRRPSALQLEVNGADQSSGMRSSMQEATQGLIEKLTGFTWQTLANSVYIDASVTHSFLAGTKKARTDVLAKFQNLERFESALKLVRRDIQLVETCQEDLNESEAVVKHAIESAKEGIADAKRAMKQQVTDLKSKWRKADEEHEREVRRAAGLKKKLLARKERAGKKLDALNAILAKLDAEVKELEYGIRELESSLTDCGHLYKDATCPTCQQPINKKLMKKTLAKWRKMRDRDLGDLVVVRARRAELLMKAQLLEGTCDKAEVDIAAAYREVDTKFSRLSFLHEELQKQKKARTIEHEQLEKHRKRLKDLIRRRVTLVENQEALDDDKLFLQYAEDAFSRDGIPAFLNRQLCPVLNKAAAYYSELFADKEIQIRFEVEDGEFEPRVLNTSGGPTVDDQSTGEKAMAGLITSFALREAAPACNVLVLDEPGTGLDAKGARQFAAALPKLQKRFGTIFLTTHNQAMLQELAGQRLLTVVKEKGISRIH
jgi:DNA repair exonuclease SbcCD ATPase subunit